MAKITTTQASASISNDYLHIAGRCIDLNGTDESILLAITDLEEVINVVKNHLTDRH